MTHSTTELKRCSKKENCIHPEQVDGGWLPATLDYFHFDKYTNRLRNFCKKCHNQTAKKTYNRERKAETVKKYAKSHPEVQQKKKQNFKERHPDKLNEYSRDWYWRNVEEQRERSNAYRAKNIDKVNKQKRAYHKKHPEVNQLSGRRYRAKKKGLPNTLTQDEWKHALQYFDNCCAICGRPEGNGYHIAADHWIPIKSKNCPRTVRENIVPICHSITKGVYGACNNSKSVAMPETWLKRKFGEERAKEILEKIQEYFQQLHEIKTE